MNDADKLPPLDPALPVGDLDDDLLQTDPDCPRCGVRTRPLGGAWRCPSCGLDLLG